MLFGAAVKILSEYFLVGLPACNIYGAPISTFLCQMTVCAIGFSAVLRYSAYARGMLRILFCPFLAALPSVTLSAAGYFLLRRLPLSPSVSTLSAILLAALGYLFLVGRCGAICASDLDKIPIPHVVRRILFPREKRAQ
jgi:stage V sporulation protein B